MSLDDVLRRILLASLPDLRERISVLALAAESLADGRLSGEDREAAHRAAHQLLGSLGTLGVADGSAPAEALERCFDPASGPLGPADGAAARLLVEALGAAVENSAR